MSYREDTEVMSRASMDCSTLNEYNKGVDRGKVRGDQALWHVAVVEVVA
tara:strand:+ start:374 stop:520 length:147 start_codon:yes stop_codon:yes gene_type:complete